MNTRGDHGGLLCIFYANLNRIFHGQAQWSRSRVQASKAVFALFKNRPYPVMEQEDSRI